MNSVRLLMIQNRQVRLAVVFVTLLSIFACIPTITLEEYRKSFGVVRTTATDLNIQTEFYAKELADDPASMDPPSLRADKYAKRVKAIEFRQNALTIIDQYNDVLAALATGNDPKAVEGSLQSIKSGLEALQIDQLTEAVAPVVPYIGVVSQAIVLIDDAIKAKKFKEAAGAAKKPLVGILKILEDDADSIQKIVDARLERVYNQNRSAIANARFTFQATAKAFSDEPAVNDKNVPTVAQVQKRMDDLLASLALWPNESKLTPLPRILGKATPDPTEISSLSAIVDQVEKNVELANRAVNSRTAHESYINAYKNALKATERNFGRMYAAIEDARLVGTIRFTKQALDLRKAYLKVRREIP